MKFRKGMRVKIIGELFSRRGKIIKIDKSRLLSYLVEFNNGRAMWVAESELGKEK